MNWLPRRGAVASHEGDAPADPAALDGTVQAAPGIAALLDGLRSEAGATVLDLGPATHGNLRCFGTFARRIRFVDLLTVWRSGGSLGDALEGLRRHPDGPYDLVLAWNFLDQVSPEQRPGVVTCLGAVMEPGARLHFMIDMSEESFVRPSRFTVLDADHVRREHTGPPQPAQPRLLPADVERLMRPFRIVHAFVLRSGMREYVAVRR